MSRDLLLKAREHFRADRTVVTLQKIAVPEWGFDIYYWPVMSVEERIAVRSHVRMGEGATLGDMVPVSLTQIIKRARDPHGTRMFIDSDRAALEDTNPLVLERISAQMGYGTDITIEAAEGN